MTGRERPVLMSAPMVLALQDMEETKTETRRAMKVQPSAYVPTENKHPTTRTEAYFDAYCGERKTDANPRGMSEHWCWWAPDERQGPDWIRCPYGVPGDLLWVKETHRVAGWDDSHYATIEYRADGARSSRPILTDDIDGWTDRQCRALEKQGAVEVASAEYDRVLRLPEGVVQHWKPAIFMPRWASRILLEVTSVRVERLRAITGEGAVAEGAHERESATSDHPYRGLCEPRWSMQRPHPVDLDPVKGHQRCLGHPRMAFANLWNEINGVDAWDENPFVWVVTFKRVFNMTFIGSGS